jgi:hypothetical protein
LHGGCPESVRIQLRLSRKRYLGSKYTYEYERISLPIPRKFHNKVRPFLKQDLNMDLSIKGSYVVITLTPAKTFLPAEYTPQKSTPESLQTLEFKHKMQIPFKYGLAEKFSPIDISARRNIFAQISAYKKVLINVIGYFGIIFSQRVAW